MLNPVPLCVTVMQALLGDGKALPSSISRKPNEVQMPGSVSHIECKQTSLLGNFIHYYFLLLTEKNIHYFEEDEREVLAYYDD
jgi:hypothetical protein